MKWARVNDVLWRTAPGYLVLGRPDGSMTEVGGPGAEIWQQLDQPIAEATIVTHLVEIYGVDRSVIAPDVVRLLLELESEGHVHRLH